MTKFNTAFWKWFGDSKVVDSKGQPLVVWHAGTIETEFDIDRCEFGCHFGPMAQATSASKYSKNTAKPYFLSIQKPLRVPDLFVFDALSVADTLLFIGIISKDYHSHVVNGELGDETDTVRALRTKLKASGYDGMVYLNRHEGVAESCLENVDADPGDLSDAEFKKFCPKARDSWLILDAKQVKSATTNDGSWDADDSDIRSNPDDIEFLPYIDYGMKGLLLRRGSSWKFVAWPVSREGSPHHDQVYEDYFQDYDLAAKVGFDRNLIYVQTTEFERKDAIRLAAKVLPDFVWDNIYSDDDFILEYGFNKKTKVFNESESIRVREMRAKLGLDIRRNPGKRR